MEAEMAQPWSIPLWTLQLQHWTPSTPHPKITNKSLMGWVYRASASPLRPSNDSSAFHGSLALHLPERVGGGSKPTLAQQLKGVKSGWGLFSIGHRDYREVHASSWNTVEPPHPVRTTQAATFRELETRNSPLSSQRTPTCKHVSRETTELSKRETVSKLDRDFHMFLANLWSVTAVGPSQLISPRITATFSVLAPADALGLQRQWRT